MRKAILILLTLFFLPTSVSAFRPIYGFTDQEYDRESDLMYYDARYYDQDVGRFTQPDPVVVDSPQDYLTDPQQFNTYSYARNNPVKYIDPDGRANIEFQPYYSSSGINYNYGESLGAYRGLQVYSRGSKGVYTNEYQCVSFAKDFSESQYGVSLDKTGNAHAFGEQSALNSSFSRNNPDNPGQYVAYDNGGNVMPQENDIISWTNEGVGHVGVISEVTFDDTSGEGYVYSIEQNYSRDKAIFYQKFTRSNDETGQPLYSIEGRGNYTVQGWARYKNQSSLNSSSNYTNIPYTPATQPPIEY